LVISIGEVSFFIFFMVVVVIMSVSLTFFIFKFGILLLLLFGLFFLSHFRLRRFFASDSGFVDISGASFSSCGNDVFKVAIRVDDKAIAQTGIFFFLLIEFDDLSVIFDDWAKLI
jgi:hypothetical protein